MRGFTLIELMVVVAISAILAAVAIPQFSQFVGTRAIDAQISALVSDMRLARSEALKRATPVTICPTTNPEAAVPQCTAAAANTGWASGWIVFSDLGTRGSITGNDTIIRVQPGFPGSGGMVPSAGAAYTITFNANGIATGLGNTFEIKNKATPTTTANNKCLVISQQGSTRQSKPPC